MSVDGETLSAITGMEEACATARARVEDLVAEVDDLRRCLCSVIAQRDEAQAELSTLRKDYDSVLEANVGLLDDAPWADVRRAYIRGAEAMREACAIRGGDKAYERMTKFWPPASGMKQAVRDAIRALPIPEEP